jgi:microcystin degradation protein MlrC
MRIGIIGIQHESNTFISTPTDLDLFKEQNLAIGDQVREKYRDTHHEVGGFFQGLDEHDIEAVGIIGAVAMPSGTVTGQTLDELLKIVFDGLDAAGQLDGLLVAPHGAGVSEKHRDMDGYWLSLLRDRVGKDLPIICTLDAHTNLSQRMIDACDATVIYRTNPHLDQRQCGVEAANLMARTLRGEIKPTQACALPPIVINIEKQFTDDPPCRPMYDLADQILKRPGVLSNSVALGYPYADVAEMGSGFIVVTDNNPTLAQQYADELAQYLFDHRDEFVANLISIDDAIDQAKAASGSVCLLDMGDNVGGGSSADGTFIAHRLHAKQIAGSFVAINDPQSAEQCRGAGVGAELELTIGGKTDDLHGQPLTAQVTVRYLGDGIFTEDQPRHGGRSGYVMGPTAIVETEHGLTIQLTSIRTAPFSLGQIRCCDLDPGRFKILVAKGVNAPVAAYREVCDTFIRVNTPGSTSADMNSFTFHTRRRPLFPLEPIDSWSASGG